MTKGIKSQRSLVGFFFASKINSQYFNYSYGRNFSVSVNYCRNIIYFLYLTKTGMLFALVVNRFAFKNKIGGR